MISKELEEFIKDETKAFEERLRAKAEELQGQIDSIDEPKTIWDLGVRDEEYYYLLASNGVIVEYPYCNKSDEDARDMGNAFLTEDEAEFERERRKIEAVMRRYSRPFAIYKRNYYIYYDYGMDKVIIDKYYSVSDGIPYFESEEITQKVIDEIGEDKLKKYWFRVTK